LRRAGVSITIWPRERRFSDSSPAIPRVFAYGPSVSKLILISVLLATIALPAVAARDTNPRRGLRRTIKYMALFYAFYLFGLLFLYGRF
jgi:hypothetical protein